MIIFDNPELTDKELLEGWMENFHTYLLNLQHSNKGFLSLPQHMVIQNKISSWSREIQDTLQDIKNLQ